MLTKMYNIFKSISNLIRSIKNQQSYTASLRLIEINKTEENEYIVTIQVINKNMIFHSKPEELLAEDSIVDQFSPRDIRALTYLGYLDINSPKYKILAQRLSESQDKLVFALKQKGKKEIMVKTASEIMSEKEILNSLSPIDSNIVAYTSGSESILIEKKQKQEILQQQIEEK